ncbi:MAG: lipid A biosynthesis acyltransferase, partial [Bacteroidetes bacterium]
VYPNKEESEIRQLSKAFYHHFCDILLEMAVFPFKSEKAAKKRIHLTNPELLETLYAEGKMVMAVCGHYGNWEYYSVMGFFSSYSTLAVYKPLKNPYFDRWVRRNRMRFGSAVTPMEKVYRELFSAQKAGRQMMTLFVADQSPMYHQIQYWTKFLGQDTPLYLGVEKLAKKFDAAVVFFHMTKPRRGRYQLEIKLICKSPAELPGHGITDGHVQHLEKLINDAPQFWLWSHRRWKHSYERFLKEKA